MFPMFVHHDAEVMQVLRAWSHWLDHDRIKFNTSLWKAHTKLGLALTLLLTLSLAV